MYKPGDLIDGKYAFIELCSDEGGMGCVLHVEPINLGYRFPVVLKYCREADEEFRRRFRREVRLLVEFQGNSKIVQVVDHNLEHEPPYFVMRYYPEGDLLRVADRLRADVVFQEQILNQMIDCVAELHAAGKFHRDIKPQNFLIDGDTLVVSDFGVSREIQSDTGATRTSMFIGTVGYMPPEFTVPGGFKSADAASDNFMLGKSFYVLLSGRDPRYHTADGIPETLFAVIDRCCAVRREGRYGDLGTLKQRLTAVYDVLLGRHHGPGELGQTLAEIQERFQNENRFDAKQVKRFIDLLQTLHEDDRTKIIFESKKSLFSVLAQESMQSHLPAFLDTYRVMVENATYPWSYAETIAEHMQVLFQSPSVGRAEKVRALEIAIVAADRQNRYAAMDTCRAMIISVKDEGLGMRVAEMLSGYLHGFIGMVEPASANTHAIRGLLEEHNKTSET